MTEPGDGYCCRCCAEIQGEIVGSGIRDWEYGVDGEWEHVRCLRCGVVQLSPFPTIELLRRAYEIDYHGYAATSNKGLIYSLLYRLNDALLWRQLRRLAPPPARVLDVGCGAGEFLATLRRLGYRSLTGIDFSERAIRLVLDKGIQAFKGLFLQYPVAEHSFDLVVMNNYLEHTLDPPDELRQAKRVLAPGGVLFGEVPNFRALDRMLFGRFWGGNHAPRHTFHFTPGTLTRLLQQTGFSDVHILQQVNTGHLALSVQNALQSGSEDLARNPRLRHGRASYYPLLLLGFLPLNALLALSGMSGIMKFSARA